MSEQKKILIADDEEDITWAVSRSLLNCGLDLDVTCVNSGDEAYDSIREEAFQLVVSDLRMPGRSGLEVIREARRLHPEVKIIIMSAYGSQDMMERAESLGSFFYIEKPFDIGHLKRLILEALGVQKDGFDGRIEKAGIRKLVELNCTTRSNTSLSVSQREQKGVIYFRNGDVVHAECGNLKGERAFFNILNWNRGTFRIHYHETPEARTISRDWQALLHQRLTP